MVKRGKKGKKPGKRDDDGCTKPLDLTQDEKVSE